MTHMAASRIGNLRFRLGYLPLGILIILLAYPLSMGPAYWLLNHGQIPQAWFNAVYKPLKPLTLNSTLFRKYLDMCGGGL